VTAPAPWRTVAVGATLALLAGCELIAGIDDRALGPPGGSGGSPGQTGAGGGGGSLASDGGFDRPLDAGGGAGGFPAGSGGRIDAGSDASDGATGAGGGAGTGGMAGTGGGTGTGGVTGAGGRTGTGGAAGTGGGTGTGGVTGTGGATSTGGVTGTGGATGLPTCDSNAQNNMSCLYGSDVDCNRLCGLDLAAIGVTRASVTCGCSVVGEWSCSACTYPSGAALACFHLPSPLVACPRDGTALLKTGTSTCPAPQGVCQSGSSGLSAPGS